jgi:hypothetical protein
MKSEHDYRNTSPRRFRPTYNPAAGIPTEPKNVGTRWLDEDEFVRLYRWLECPDAAVDLLRDPIAKLEGKLVEPNGDTKPAQCLGEGTDKCGLVRRGMAYEHVRLLSHVVYPFVLGP